jgi:lysozyme family protein
MTFNECFDFIKDFEGGYVNDPQDPGGETNFGISKRAYPNLNIKTLTLDRAKQIYYSDYWVASKADKLPPELRLMHFDCAVNQGIGAANKILQEAIGNPKVKIDGVVGPITLKHASETTPDAYGFYRLIRYMNTIGARHSSAKYAKGWARRLKDCLETTYEYIT